MAVYTLLSRDQISNLLGLYNAGDLIDFSAIEAGIENSNYLIKTTTNKYILTIYEKRVDVNDLPFYIALTEHFNAQGINCPVMIKDKNGVQIQDVAGKKACLISFLSGKDIQVFEDSHIAQLGEQIAAMHLAATDFKQSRLNNLGMRAWVKLFEKIGVRADEFKPGLTKLIEDEIYFLAANWPFNLPAGVIHADIFPDNVFFENGNLSGVIDFYFACTDYFAYDLAITINAWGLEKDEHKKSLLLDSYQKIRKLSVEEIAALPVLLRGAAMRFLLTRLYDWFNTPDNALVKKKDPGEYLAKLQFFQTTA